MGSYGYQNKYKTIAWESVGRLESDFTSREDYDHAAEVLRAVPTITYSEGGEEYYPQVACSWHESEYHIDFKDRAIYLCINNHWKEPELDENGYYQYADLEGEDSVELIRINKKDGKIKKYKLIEEEEIEVKDIKDKIKYNIPVSVEEAVNYWIEKAKERDAIYIAGYYDDLRHFIPTDTFGYGCSCFGKDIDKETFRSKIEEHQRDCYPDSRYTVYVNKDSTWEEIKKELQEKRYLKADDCKLNYKEDKKEDQNNPDDDLPF